MFQCKIKLVFNKLLVLFLCSRSVDIGVFDNRIECIIREYPPRTTTISLGRSIFNTSDFPVNISGESLVNIHKLLYVCITLILKFFFVHAVNGFCDFENSSDLQFGNYTWEESIGGELVMMSCVNVSNANVVRQCYTRGDGWGEIDYTSCRISKAKSYST